MTSGIRKDALDEIKGVPVGFHETHDTDFSINLSLFCRKPLSLLRKEDTEREFLIYMTIIGSLCREKSAGP